MELKTYSQQNDIANMAFEKATFKHLLELSTFWEKIGLSCFKSWYTACILNC